MLELQNIFGFGWQNKYVCQTIFSWQWTQNCPKNQGPTVHVTDVLLFLHKSLRKEEIDIEKFLLRGKLLFLVQFKTVASTQRKV